MRRRGLWNPALVGELARLGHGETIVLADAGLPVPVDVATVDLVWSRGEPRLAPVLRAVLDELVVERATVAEELDRTSHGPDLLRELGDLPLDRVRHQRFKDLVGMARLVVRTGEASAYANVILHAGVAF